MSQVVKAATLLVSQGVVAVALIWVRIPSCHEHFVNTINSYRNGLLLLCWMFHAQMCSRCKGKVRQKEAAGEFFKEKNEVKGHSTFPNRCTLVQVVKYMNFVSSGQTKTQGGPTEEAADYVLQRADPTTGTGVP